MVQPAPSRSGPPRRAGRAFIAGAVLCGALGFGTPAALAAGEGNAGGMGGACPMGQNGDPSAPAGGTGSKRPGNTAPLTAPGGPSTATPSAPAAGSGASAPSVQRAVTSQPVSVTTSATASSGATASATVPVTQAISANQPAAVDMAAVRRAERQAGQAQRIAERRAERQLARERQAALRTAALEARTAGFERWHAPARGSDLPAPAPVAVSADAGAPVLAIAGGLGLLMLAGLALVLRRRRGGEPVAVVTTEPVQPPAADAIEAELQEILAEEHAARMLSERERVEL